MNLSPLAGKNIHVVGTTGAEGSAVVDFLARQLPTAKITTHDFCPAGDFARSFWSFHDAYSEEEKKKLFDRLRQLPIKFHWRNEYLKDIEQAEIIFVPQSWFRYAINQPLQSLSKKNAFYNITKLYFNLCPAPIVAVTGTSGKSTTTRLIYEMLKRGKRRVYFTGNDRYNRQVLDSLTGITADDLLVIEVSNRQLMVDLERSPHIGVITNISPNHLDDHHNYESYIEVKKSLLRYQTAKDFAVLNYDNAVTRAMAGSLAGQACFFSGRPERAARCLISNNEIFITTPDHQREYKICQTREIVLPGPHNLANVVAAALAAWLAGSSTKDIRAVATTFAGLPSRLELVREFQGVKYYEDSSACNPDGASVAVQSFKNPLVLIAGGTRKVKAPGEFERLAESIVHSSVKVLLLIGAEAPLIERMVRQALADRVGKKGLLIRQCQTLSEAVTNACRLAKTGEAVILSPGCESFGMFKDYRDRGRQFKQLVNQLQ